MSIRQINHLLIGELGAATVINDHGIVYIGLGTVEAGEELLGIDWIEARALHEWLGRALGLTSDAATEQSK